MNNHFPAILQPLLKPILLDALGCFFVSFLIPIVAHQEFQADGFQMGLLFSLQALGTGVSALLFAGKVNRWASRAQLIRFAAFIRSFAYLCLYAAILSKHYWLMVFATFVLGFGSGLFWLIWQTCFAQISQFEHRAQTLGFASKQIGLGIMIGSGFAFSLLGFAEGFQLADYIIYLSLPVFSLACLFAGCQAFTAISVMTLQYPQTQQQNPQKINFTLLTVFLFAMIFVGQLSGSLVAPFLEVYLLEHLHISSVSQLSLAYIPGGILAMILAPKLGAFADKVNAALYLTCAGIIGAFTTWLMLQSGSLWQISLLFIVDASVITSSGLVLAKLISEVAGENKGSAFGLQGFISNFGAISGPLVGGLFWQLQGSQGPFVFSISTELLLAACCLVILWPALRVDHKLLKP